ncbi:dynamin family protein [Vibrio cholerae]
MKSEIINDIRLDLIDYTNAALSKVHKVKLNKDIESGVATFLKNEKSKLTENLFTIGVVGVMKAGKSTFINAIIGREILPSRTLGMTFIPTKIQHAVAVDDVEYSFGKYAAFQNFADWLQLGGNLSKVTTTAIKSKVANELITALEKKELKLRKRVTSLEEAQKELFLVNDLARLNAWLRANNDCPIDLLEHIKSESDIPTIYTQFKALGESILSNASLALIDSPGPDEAGQNETLTFVLKQVLQNASGVYCIINGKKIDDLSDEALRKQVHTYRDILADRLQLIVNQKDQIDRRLDVKEVISSNHTFQDFDLVDKVHTLSSKAALYCALMKERAQDFAHNYECYRNDPPKWFVEFASLRGGLESYLADLDDELEDSRDLAEVLIKHSTRIIKSSGFNEFISDSLINIYKNASLSVVTSAVDKLRAKIDEPILHTINGRLKSIELDHEELISIQKELRVTIKKIESVQNRTEELISSQFQNTESSNGILDSILKNTGHPSIQKARSLYQELKQLIDNSNKKKHSTKSSAQNDLAGLKEKIETTVLALGVELRSISEAQVSRKIGDINSTVEEELSDVIETTKRINSKVSDWEFIMPSLDEYSNTIDFEALSINEINENKIKEYDRKLFGFTFKPLNYIFGKRKENEIETTYQINLFSLNEMMKEHIDNTIEHAFEQGRLVAYSYQEKLTDYSETLSNIVNQTLMTKEKSQAEMKEEISELKADEQWFSGFRKYLITSKQGLSND